MNETAHYDEWTNQHNKSKKVFVRPGDNGKQILCLMSEFLYFPRLQRGWTKIKRTYGLCLNFYRCCVLCPNFCIFPCFQLSWTKIKRSYVRISIHLTTCVWISIISHVSCGSGQKLKDLILNFHRFYVLRLGFYIYISYVLCLNSYISTASFPAGLELFRDFLRSEFSDENLEFWIAVEEFKQSKASKVPSMAQRIYTDFVAPQAPREVGNLPHFWPPPPPLPCAPPHLSPLPHTHSFSTTSGRVTRTLKLIPFL